MVRERVRRGAKNYLGRKGGTLVLHRLLFFTELEKGKKRSRGICEVLLEFTGFFKYRTG